jgi:hypothetical protein
VVIESPIVGTDGKIPLLIIIQPFTQVLHPTTLLVLGHLTKQCNLLTLADSSTTVASALTVHLLDNGAIMINFESGPGSELQIPQDSLSPADFAGVADFDEISYDQVLNHSSILAILSE